ncbi:MAG: hypothetical protein LBQ73_02275 [Tannerellaceae bacterium]|nr:hypothetical protein [Tannerellaceae bacterium]
MAANHILGGDYIYEVFTASRNWVPPQGVGLIEAFVVGPGADGGAGYSSVTTAQVSGYGGAGGAGGQVVTYEISVDEGEDVSVVINNTMSYIKNDSFKAVVGGGSGGGIGSYARYAINYGSFDTRAAGGGGYGTYAFDGATIAIPGFQNRRFGAGGGGGGSRSSTYGGGDASAASGGDYGGGSGNSGGGAGGAATFYGAGGGGGSSPWSYSSSVSGGAGGAGYQGIIIIRYKINEPSNQENQ